MEDFSKPKIVYSEIVRSPQFYLDETEHFLPEATAFLMTGSNLTYLTSLLNSPIIATIFKMFYSGGGLGADGYRYKKVFIEKLPLPLPKSNNTMTDIDILKAYGFDANEMICLEGMLYKESYTL